MKKIIAFSLVVLLLGIICQVPAQTVKPIPTVTLSGTDTLSGAVTKNFALTLNGNYNWSAEIYYDHLTGASDSCKCNIQESVDGTHYLTVVGSPTASFTTADAPYIWTGGTGNLPLVWPSNYFRVSCTHYATGTARPYLNLQLKNK